MSNQSFNSSGRAPRAGGASPVEDEFISDEKAIDKFSTASSATPTHSAQQTVKPVNLLAKAVALLSRREHSEQELRRKLAKYTDDVQQIDTVIARLQKENWQSDERFAENFVLFRQERWGNQKILQALRQHHLPIETVATLKENLRETEFSRAQEVWERKFHGQYPTTPQEKAKQMRFLASRGFSADIVYKVLQKRK
ncbi:recombination regulator RecX [Pelistega suis]|uniref:recombination regulator RecX n=1 Tax=Pelistega suis TaxID=1631957 RepID=UPI00211CADF2|nr:recombination regulator RecX [Pelistega suis]MCQ9328691.1 recombination regulator RecX [Pelistega suis]